MIRIVGLSATLPNYGDVGAFLGVNPDTGLFYFDASYRPVPLEMQFVGVSERNILAQKSIMDEVCFQKVRSPESFFLVRPVMILCWLCSSLNTLEINKSGAHESM